MSPYGITIPQWVKLFVQNIFMCHPRKGKLCALPRQQYFFFLDIQWIASSHHGVFLAFEWKMFSNLNIMAVFPGMGISMIKMRWSWDQLIFIMRNPILVRRHLYIEMAPCILPLTTPVPTFSLSVSLSVSAWLFTVLLPLVVTIVQGRLCFR